jgi:nucleotide-binding universal stress UspA family protein/hemerythrin-like domain-containing protein
MYQHILVPLDGSTLSGDTVEQALKFARFCKARVTFFHARPDFGVTGDGAILHTVAPTVFAEGAEGNSRSLLAKAAAASRAAGVECEIYSVVSGRPYHAIQEAATSQQCDLIFMASHGRRGFKSLLSGSVTQKVLQHTKLPVLVATVESNIAIDKQQIAIGIIKDEHRSLAAVIHGLQHLGSEIERNVISPRFDLLHAMLFYIEVFPEKLHHPKEDAYLFRKLRSRTRECDDLISELEGQHIAGKAQFTRLREKLEAYQKGTDGASADFSNEISEFAEAHWRHMAAEETLILPAASRHLTESDWKEVANAFLGNKDPRFDKDAGESFETLFERILRSMSLTAHS